MKDFETVTEYEILNMVWAEILCKIIKEEEMNKEFKKKYNKPNEISEYRLKKLNKQAEEIKKRLIEFEQNK